VLILNNFLPHLKQSMPKMWQPTRMFEVEAYPHQSMAASQRRFPSSIIISESTGLDTLTGLRRAGHDGIIYLCLHCSLECVDDDQDPKDKKSREDIEWGELADWNRCQITSLPPRAREFQVKQRKIAIAKGKQAMSGTLPPPPPPPTHPPPSSALPG
jgi:hypothetical protein